MPVVGERFKLSAVTVRVPIVSSFPETQTISTVSLVQVSPIGQTGLSYEWPTADCGFHGGPFRIVHHQWIRAADYPSSVWQSKFRRPTSDPMDWTGHRHGSSSRPRIDRLQRR